MPTGLLDGWEPPAGIRRSRKGAQTHWAKGNSSDLEGDRHEDDEDGGGDEHDGTENEPNGDEQDGSHAEDD